MIAIILWVILCIVVLACKTPGFIVLIVTVLIPIVGLGLAFANWLDKKLN